MTTYAISNSDQDLIRELQECCAIIEERDETFLPTPIRGEKREQIWSDWDVIEVARIFNRSEDPISLFRFVDERTGDFRVGYKTRDGREWFHVLRQMRNSSGMFFDLIRREAP